MINRVQRELKEEDIIFLISQPRSGSTLLQTILQTSGEVSSNEETWSALVLCSLLKSEINFRADFDFSLGQKALCNFLAYKNNREVYNEGIKHLLVDLYSNSTEHGKQYFLEKTPRNYFILDELYHAFPKAKYILLVRNPVSVLESICRTWCTIDKLEDLGVLHGFYYDLMLAPSAMSQFHSVHCQRENVIKVSFEELVKNPDTELNRLNEFLQLKYKLNSHYGKLGDFEWGDKYTLPLYSAIEGSLSEKWKQSKPLIKSVLWFYLKSLKPNLKNFMYSEYSMVENYLRDFEDSTVENTWHNLFDEPKLSSNHLQQIQNKEAVIQKYHHDAQELQIVLQQKEELVQKYHHDAQELQIVLQQKEELVQKYHHDAQELQIVLQQKEELVQKYHHDAQELQIVLQQKEELVQKYHHDAQELQIILQQKEEVIQKYHHDLLP